MRAGKLEEVAKKRAAELLTLSELGERLSYLKEEREVVQRRLATVRGRIETLEGFAPSCWRCTPGSRSPT